MTLPARRVRHLRLRLPADDLARGSAIALEDAFHTASLPPAEDSRLWIVRRLALGRIRHRASTATLALTIQQRFHELGRLAIHAEDPAARDSPAVFFHDPFEPYRCLARRLIADAPIDDWFWPLALPDWNGHRSRGEIWRRLILDLIRQPAGVVELARLIQELPADKVAGALCEILQPDDGETLLQMCGWKVSSPAASATRVSIRAKADLPPPYRSILVQCLQGWGGTDARTIWVTALALVAGKPARLARTDLMEQARGVLNGMFSAVPGIGGSAGRKRWSPGNSDLEGTPRKNPADAFESLAEPRRKPKLGEQASEHNSLTSDGPRSPDSAPTEPGSWIPSDEGPLILTRSDLPAASSYAGLFLLLTVLQRLRIDEFLAEHPDFLDLEFPPRLLGQIAQRLGATIDDPVSRILTVTSDDLSGDWPGQVSLPRGWTGIFTRVGENRLRPAGRVGGLPMSCDESGRLVLSLKPNLATTGDEAGAILLGAWQLALRRWCRRFVGLDWRSLICRRGGIRVTRTHLDIYFDHRQADARIRKAGLDLDPGWLPWLGRVIKFHYLCGEQSHGG